MYCLRLLNNFFNQRPDYLFHESLKMGEEVIMTQFFEHSLIVYFFGVSTCFLMLVFIYLMLPGDFFMSVFIHQVLMAEFSMSAFIYPMLMPDFLMSMFIILVSVLIFLLLMPDFFMTMPFNLLLTRFVFVLNVLVRVSEMFRGSV